MTERSSTAGAGRRWGAALAAGLVALAAGAVIARQPTTNIAASSDRSVAPVRVLITRGMERRPVRLVAWTKAGLLAAPINIPEELAAQATGAPIPADEVLAIAAPAEDMLPGLESRGGSAGRNEARRGVAGELSRVAVELVDRQRYTGVLLSAAPVGEKSPSEAGGRADAAGRGAEPSVRIRSGSFGELKFSLDDIVRVEILDSRPAAPMLAPASRPDSTNDRVVLANGDVLEGFVEEIGAEVSVAPVGSSGDAAGKATRVPTDRCRSIEIANPQRPLAGAVAWLAGGDAGLQVVRVKEFSIGTSGEASVRPDLAGVQAASSIASDSIVGIAPDASKFLPLGDLGAPRFTPLAGRRWSQPPQVGSEGGSPLGLRDITLPGAMAVEWDVPEEVSAISGSVVLPASARLWGDCTVLVEAVWGGGAPAVLWTGRLNGDHPRSDVSAGMARPEAARGGAVLRVSVQPGPRGAIQDRVVLEGFMLVRRGSGK